MIDTILRLRANPWIAVGLYWLPVAFCAFGYILRTARNFRKDREQRSKPGAIYIPSDTYGTLIGRGLMTVIPLANVCAAVFDLAPEIFGKFFEWLGRVFNQPLVPDLPNGNELRRGGK